MYCISLTTNNTKSKGKYGKHKVQKAYISTDAKKKLTSCAFKTTVTEAVGAAVGPDCTVMLKQVNWKYTYWPSTDCVGLSVASAVGIGVGILVGFAVGWAAGMEVGLEDG